MSEDADAEVKEESEIAVYAGYVPETAEEWRRQWCLSLAADYCGGGDYKKMTQAATHFEKFLIGNMLKQV